MILRKYLLYAISFLQILLILGPAPWLNAGDTTSVPRISVDQVNLLLSKPDTVIIDVRKPRNWWRTSKKILTAVREEPSKVDQWARKYAKDHTLIFY
jgi:hypothetical protein